MTQVKDIKFEGTGSHSIKLGSGYAVESEEVFLYFSASWLNKPVRFTQRASWYRGSGGRTEWRNYVVEARYVVEVECANGVINTVSDGSVSDKARRALDLATDQLVKGWLVSDEDTDQYVGPYTQSYARALGNAIQQLGDDRYEPWKKVNGAVSVHHETLGDDVKESLRNWATSLFEVSRERENVTRALEKNEWFNPYHWKKISREEVSP